MAQKVSPALIALDDEGRIGIRTIDADNIVEFHLVEIIADAENGVWVSGLPNRTGLITVGQELVTAGERVDPVYQTETAMPASKPTPDRDPNQGYEAESYPTASEGLDDQQLGDQSEDAQLQQATAPDTTSAAHTAVATKPHTQHAAL